MYVCVLGHKTITISDSAYRALKKMKKKSESFTDVILRLSVIVSKSGANERKRGIDKLSELVEESKDFPDQELADNIEKASREFRKNFRLREARVL